MRRIFQFNPKYRPNATELLTHEYFLKFNRYSISKPKVSFRITVQNKK
jgi:hypothetical protein